MTERYYTYAVEFVKGAGATAPLPIRHRTGGFDGDVVVYDPVTHFIANMADLLARWLSVDGGREMRAS